MRFVIEFRLSPSVQTNVTDIFRNWHPTKRAGVTFRGARIGRRTDVIFVLGESDDEELIAQACEPWNEHGSYQVYTVPDRR